MAEVLEEHFEHHTNALRTLLGYVICSTTLQLWSCLSHTARLSFFQLQMQTHILHLLWCPPCPAQAHWLWQRSELQLVYFAMQLHKIALCMCSEVLHTRQCLGLEIHLAHLGKFFIGTAACISATEYILPWLRYASSHSTCAVRELGTPQR